MTIGLANEARSAEANALDALLASGKVKIYADTRPATPDTAVTTQVLIATINLGNPAYGNAVNGVITLAGVPLQGTAVATDTATWARFEKADASPVFDADVGESASDLIISNASVQIGYVIEITSHSFTVPVGG